MRVVARAEVRALLRRRGAVWVGPRAYRCCGGRRYVVEASLEVPPGEFELWRRSSGRWRCRRP